jgi:5-formyltetrahydrofolate cyclo-ligase
MTVPREIPDGKAALRRHYRAVRRSSLSGITSALKQAALRDLPPLLDTPGRLGLYWPLQGEPDLDPFAAGGLAEQLGDRLALPAVVPLESGSAQSLVYLPWRRGMALLPDACGIPAPAGQEPQPPQSLALLLVPALAIDSHGIRLGSGGGWYDRLRSDPAWRAVPALAVLPAACLTPALPRDPWDVPFDGWLDETGLHWIEARALLPGQRRLA